MNAELVSQLTELANIASILGEVYKEKAFRVAINTISKLDWSIKANPERLNEKLIGIGEGIKKRLLEYCKTGKLATLEEQRADPKVKAHFVLEKIVGVGPATVKDWIRRGIYNLSDLRREIAKGRVELNKMQKFGLNYYDDLNTRIPRDEVTAIGKIMQKAITEIEPSIIFTIAGSYRRGAETSGDVDILIASRDWRSDLIHSVLNKLREDPNFIDTISVGKERITMLYKYDKVRQIDILYLPYEEYYAGCLYFTGDWAFNEAMRGYARKKGFRLNQRGLYKLFGTNAKLVKVDSEEAIFAALGLKFVEPPQRIGAVWAKNKDL